MPSIEQSTRRVLPPDVSAADFDAALAEFRRIVGDKWVADTPEGIRPYEDAFPVAGDDQFTPGAVVFPDTTEQVQEIVRVANRYLIPLHAVSTGKNLGYGGSSPRTRGSVVLHLGTRMNRILELNERYGYALVEPGVTYIALHEHIKKHGYNLMIDAPDLAWGSIIGNTMDRGVGYTPYGNHSAWKSGLEIVLPDGDLLRTGLGGLPGSNTWQLFAPSFGPQPDNLFEQSNYGIVTKMGIQRMQPPPYAQTFLITFEQAEDLPQIIDTMFPLRINMAQLQTIAVLRNILLDAAPGVPAGRLVRGRGSHPRPRHRGDEAEAEPRILELLRDLLRPAAVVEQYLTIIRDAFGQIPGASPA